MEYIQRDAQHPAPLRVQPVADVERLPHGVHAGTVSGIHGMERLDGERHVGAAGVLQQRADAILHQGARGPDILRGRRARPGILRQATHHENEAGRAQSDRLIHGAPIVVADLGQAGGVSREHPARQ